MLLLLFVLAIVANANDQALVARRRLALHEASHAVVAMALDFRVIDKVDITGDRDWDLVNSEIPSRSEVIDWITVLMAPVALDQVHWSDDELAFWAMEKSDPVLLGRADDIEQAHLLLDLFKQEFALGGEKPEDILTRQALVALSLIRTHKTKLFTIMHHLIRDGVATEKELNVIFGREAVTSPSRPIRRLLVVEESDAPELDKPKGLATKEWLVDSIVNVPALEAGPLFLNWGITKTVTPQQLRSELLFTIHNASVSEKERLHLLAGAVRKAGIDSIKVTYYNHTLLISASQVNAFMEFLKQKQRLFANWGVNKTIAIFFEKFDNDLILSVSEPTRKEIKELERLIRAAKGADAESGWRTSEEYGVRVKASYANAFLDLVAQKQSTAELPEPGPLFAAWGVTDEVTSRQTSHGALLFIFVNMSRSDGDKLKHMAMEAKSQGIGAINVRWQDDLIKVEANCSEVFLAFITRKRSLFSSWGVDKEVALVVEKSGNLIFFVQEPTTEEVKKIRRMAYAAEAAGIKPTMAFWTSDTTYLVRVQANAFGAFMDFISQKRSDRDDSSTSLFSNWGVSKPVTQARSFSGDVLLSVIEPTTEEIDALRRMIRAAKDAGIEAATSSWKNDMEYLVRAEAQHARALLDFIAQKKSDPARRCLQDYNGQWSCGTLPEPGPLFAAWGVSKRVTPSWQTSHGVLLFTFESMSLSDRDMLKSMAAEAKSQGIDAVEVNYINDWIRVKTNCSHAFLRFLNQDRPKHEVNWVDTSDWTEISESLKRMSDELARILVLEIPVPDPMFANWSVYENVTRVLSSDNRTLEFHLPLGNLSKVRLEAMAADAQKEAAIRSVSVDMWHDKVTVRMDEAFLFLSFLVSRHLASTPLPPPQPVTCPDPLAWFLPWGIGKLVTVHVDGEGECLFVSPSFDFFDIFRLVNMTSEANAQNIDLVMINDTSIRAARRETPAFLQFLQTRRKQLEQEVDRIGCPKNPLFRSWGVVPQIIAVSHDNDGGCVYHLPIDKETNECFERIKTATSILGMDMTVNFLMDRVIIAAKDVSLFKTIMK